MESAKNIRPRTIQMKYPAPYSQSWTEANPTKGVRKSKVKSSNQSNAALRTQSLANDRSRRPKTKTAPRESSRKLNPVPFAPECCHARPLVRGPDPSAPHLKYGLFPQPRRRVQMQMSNELEEKPRSYIPDHSNRKDKKSKSFKKSEKAPEEDQPMFVFRALDPKYTRQLTVSPPSHLDIGPRDVSRRSRDEPMMSVRPLKNFRAIKTVA